MPSTYGRYGAGAHQDPAGGCSREWSRGRFGIRERCRRQLAQARQRVLEPQLFFQLHDIRQVGKQADCALFLRLAERPTLSRRNDDRLPPTHHRRAIDEQWAPGRQTLGDRVFRVERTALKSIAIITPDRRRRRFRASGAPARLRISTRPLSLDDQQARGQTFDNLSCSSAPTPRHGRAWPAPAIAAAHGLLHGRGEQRRVRRRRPSRSDASRRERPR